LPATLARRLPSYPTPKKGIIMKLFIKRMAVVSLGLMVMICALVAYGYSSRRTTPPAEVNLETAEVVIDFGDEFLPMGDEFVFDSE
jgi:hypothetical protein